MQNTILVDHIKTISSKFGCNRLNSSDKKIFKKIFKRFLVKISMAVVVIMVGECGCQTKFARVPPKDHFTKDWLELAN